MFLVENAVANVIVQRVKHLRGLPHNTAGLSCDWREQTLEANALDLQFALHDWTVRVGNRAERCRNGSDEALHLRCREPQAGFVHSFTVGFEPDTAVFIDDDLRNLRIAYGSQNSRPELSSEQFVQASLLKLLCHDHADSPLLLAPPFRAGATSSIRFSVSSTSARSPRWRRWPEARACLRCASGISGKWLSMLSAN